MQHFREKSSVVSAEAESSGDEPPSKQQKILDDAPRPFLRYLLEYNLA